MQLEPEKAHQVHAAGTPAAPWHHPADWSPTPGPPNAVARFMSGKGHVVQAVVGDRPALEALYLATGGDQWKYRSNWMGAGSVCGWYGVNQCIEGTQQVTALDLHNSQLSGTLPEALGQMTALTDLYLYGNQLSGTLPEALGQMTALTHLYLDDNQLSGTLPEALGQMTALT
eukprot:gene13013-biopygen8042